MEEKGGCMRQGRVGHFGTAVVLALWAWAAVGCAEKSADPVLAKVGSQPITLSQVRALNAPAAGAQNPEDAEGYHTSADH
jgi:hypothetical protein